MTRPTVDDYAAAARAISQGKAINYEGAYHAIGWDDVGDMFPPLVHWKVVYTGVTRGKRLVVLLGQKKAVAIAVRNISGRRRWSKLGEWMRPRGHSETHSSVAHRGN